MPLTAARIGAIRSAAPAVLAGIFLATGLWTLATGEIPPLPSWSYAAAGLALALLSPRGACLAAHDGGSAASWLRAQTFGYWAGAAAFVVPGNVIGLAGLRAGPAFLRASMPMGAAPFVHFLVAEWRRGRG